MAIRISLHPLLDVCSLRTWCERKERVTQREENDGSRESLREIGAEDETSNGRSIALVSHQVVRAITCMNGRVRGNPKSQ